VTHEDDRALSRALLDARRAGRRCALATVVATKGSTPRKVGARMVVDPEAGLVGTVGGGCGEAEVIQAAHRVLSTGRAERVRVDLTDDLLSWSPAVCGGIMDVFVEAVAADGRAGGSGGTAGGSAGRAGGRSRSGASGGRSRSIPTDGRG